MEGKGNEMHGIKKRGDKCRVRAGRWRGNIGQFITQMMIVDIYNSRFHRIYDNREALTHILDRDDIYV